MTQHRARWGREAPLHRPTLDKTLIVLGLSYLIENMKIIKSSLTRTVVRVLGGRGGGNGSATAASTGGSRRVCLSFQRRVQDVISPIVFEAAYSLGEHVVGAEARELPALTPVLRWKKGQKIAQKNQVRARTPPAGSPGGWYREWHPGGRGQGSPLSGPPFS